MRVRSLLLALLALAPAVASAQPLDVSIDAVRARALARGWRSELVDGEERLCPSLPCSGMYERSDADVVAVRPGALLVRMRTADGWMVEASLGRPTPTFHLRFVRGADAVDIGWEHRFELPDRSLVAITGDDRLSHDLDAWLRGELDAYLRSAASFRERALRRSRELRAHVQRVAGTLSICGAPDDPGRFFCRDRRDGARVMVDSCARRALTPGERTEMLARLAQSCDRHDLLVEQNADRWHAALADLLALRR